MICIFRLYNIPVRMVHMKHHSCCSVLGCSKEQIRRKGKLAALKEQGEAADEPVMNPTVMLPRAKKKSKNTQQRQQQLQLDGYNCLTIALSGLCMSVFFSPIHPLNTKDETGSPLHTCFFTPIKKVGNNISLDRIEDRNGCSTLG
eukprot:gene4210-3042_t